jgi:hypothetical protein
VALALLPLAFLLLVFLLRRYGLEWRVALLAAATLHATFLTVATEILSLGYLVTAQNIAACWIGLCVVLIWLLIVSRVTSNSERRSTAAVGNTDPAQIEFSIKLMIAVGGLIAALVFLVALLAPPSATDSMQTYLPRVLLWIANRSVLSYPTPDYLQLIYAPWPSYAMMHTILLSGNDRFVNLIQAMSLPGCAVAVSLISKHLGAGPKGQIFAAVASLTLPQGILEASGALNSYVVAFWISAALVFLLLWKDNPNWFNTLAAGLATGLALLAKGHAYIFLPFLVLAVWWMAPPGVRLLYLKRAAVFGLIVLAVNLPAYYRNIELTGSPLGLPLPEPFRESMVMSDYGPASTSANFIRHVSAHIGTPIAAINTSLNSAVRGLIWTLGVDPDKSIYSGDTFEVQRMSLYELRAGNPLHLVLFLVAIGLLLLNRKSAFARGTLIFAAGISLAFVLVSATIVWQTTTSRYHLPLFVLAAAVTGLALEKFVPRRLALSALFLLLALGVISASVNRTRALVPLPGVPNVFQDRSRLYFADLHEADYPNHGAVADTVTKLSCDRIGIDSVLPMGMFRDSKGSLFVYPIMAIINSRGPARTFSYVGVRNLTARYRDASPPTDPCAVICFNCADRPESRDAYSRLFRQTTVFGNVTVFAND